MKRFILSTFLSLLSLGASAFTTNTFTSVDTAQVWAESAGPLKLFSLSAVNSEGADRYLMLFATDTSANGDYPIRAWKLTNSATLNLNFFPDGYYVKSVTSAQVEKHGCTFWVSTTATTLTKSTGGGVTMTSVKMAQSDVQAPLASDVTSTILQSFYTNGLSVLPRYLGVVAVSLNNGSVSRGFGFKYSVDGTNWFSLIQQAATIPSNSCFAPAITHIGTNWIVTYDVFAIAPPAVSNSWAQMISSDLINWTGPTYFTNMTVSSAKGLIGGERFFKDPVSGNTYQYLPVWSTSPEPNYVTTLTNVNNPNTWGPLTLVNTLSTDSSVYYEGGMYYMVIGEPGFVCDMLTNSIGPTSTFTEARHDILNGISIESPQMFKLGTSNYILYANASPGTYYRTLYSKANNPLGPWSRPQPINEDGNFPSRMDIYQLDVNESITVQGLIASNSIAKPYIRSYKLFTNTGATNATGPYLDFGATSVGKTTFDVIGVGGDDGTTYGAFGVHFKYEIVAFEEYGGPMFVLSQKYYDISRPDTTFGVTIQTNSGFVDNSTGNGAYGWRKLQFMVYSPNAVTMNWLVTEEIKTIDATTNITPFLDSPFGSGTTYPVGVTPPFGAAGGGTYSMVETNVGIFSGNGVGLTNLPTPIVTNFTTYATGTAYTLTGSSAALDFGTTDPVLTINQAGTYLIQGHVGVLYSGATYAGAQTVMFKFRRTNNTAADLTNGSIATELPVLTTFTGGDSVSMPSIVYTATSGDTVTVFGILSATPSVGSVQANACDITAIRLY
jgi:hypothetical protein